MERRGVPPFEESQDLEENSEFLDEYESINRLLDRLDTKMYLENKELQEEDIDELCTTVLFILDTDPGLEHILSDPKKFNLWKNISRVASKYLKKTELEENATRLSSILGRILSIANPETNKGPADKVLLGLLEKWPWGDSKYAPKFASKRSEKTKRSEAVLNEYCNQFGLNAEKLFHAWYSSHQECNPLVNPFDTRAVDPVLSVRNNLMEMRRLELHQKGAPKTLVEDFGISCFSRYPEGMLDDQIDQIDDVDTPYGLVVSSIGDHSGTFYRKSALDSINSLLRQCKNLGHNLRVIETDGNVDFLKKLLVLDKKYNKPTGQRIKFGVINGHGNEEAMQIGMDHSSVITTQDVLSNDFKRASQRFFEEGAPIVLQACLVGKKDKLAQLASDSMPNLNIIASPDKVRSVVYTLSAPKEDGLPPRLSAKYTKIIIPKKMSSYREGKKLAS